MLRNVFIGMAAGAIGTVALNVTTYGDMALRGRPTSSTPAKIAGILASKVGLPLSTQGAGSNDETAQNRESGLGALLGYVNGLGVGMVYGLLHSQMDDTPSLGSAVGVGLAAMAASDVPTVVLGVSNPTQWGFSDWASDLIPHLIYGFVTVATYNAFAKRTSPLKRARSFFKGW
jgi:xanthosine utilization system XapX-like protein